MLFCWGPAVADVAYLAPLGLSVLSQRDAITPSARTTMLVRELKAAADAQIAEVGNTQLPSSADSALLPIEDQIGVKKWRPC
jgi:hypothetical protein